MTNDILRIGIVQTSLDYQAAWKNNGKWEDAVRISSLEEKQALKEIRYYLASLYALDQKPDIVLLPELSVPLGYEKKLKRSAEAMEAIIIGGLDYKIRNKEPHKVSNEAIVIVPKRLRDKKISRRTEIRRIGKTYPSPAEKRKLKDLGIEFESHPTVWLFTSDDFGKFGVAICYDFMDLDRIVLYRNKIQTLFILAYNKDITSFHHIAQSISRTAFCNVIICNCGYYGGSLAVSPYRDSYKRTIYQHSGAKLTNAQVIELPLSELRNHQEGNYSAQLKSLPPGFQEKHLLTICNIDLQEKK